MKTGRKISFGLCIALGFGPCVGLAQQSEAAPPPENAIPAPAVEVSDKDALTAIGFMVSKRMKLDIGLSDEEMDWLLEGVRQGASSDEPPQNYQAAMGRAEQIYRAHVAALMEKRKVEAEETVKVAEAYVTGIEQSEGLTRTDSGLYYKIIEPGDLEKKPGPTDRVQVNYVGSLIDGTVFDKSTAPADFTVNGVVPGFSEGLQLVGVGGKIRLYIPGPLGYDLQPPPGSGIKPGAMLVFDVELLGVTPPVRRPPSFPAMPRTSPGAPPSMKPPPPPSGRIPPPPSMPPPPLPDEAKRK
ncbi:MAG: FKBP-type peptidyl-prolyl cis-trans isomerase [Opitutales bacterium]|jgi:FKBP-type peptidyl-prolyl cis-trans isomerase